jgi:hypothetical protein
MLEYWPIAAIFLIAILVLAFRGRIDATLNRHVAPEILKLVPFAIIAGLLFHSTAGLWAIHRAEAARDSIEVARKSAEARIAATNERIRINAEAVKTLSAAIKQNSSPDTDLARSWQQTIAKLQAESTVIGQESAATTAEIASIALQRQALATDRERWDTWRWLGSLLAIIATGGIGAAWVSMRHRSAS